MNCLYHELFIRLHFLFVKQNNMPETMLRLSQFCSQLFEIQLSDSGMSDSSDLGTDCHEICLIGKDIFVLHRQTYFMTVRDGGSTSGYA